MDFGRGYKRGSTLYTQLLFLTVRKKNPSCPLAAESQQSLKLCATAAFSILMIFIMFTSFDSEVKRTRAPVPLPRLDLFFFFLYIRSNKI